MYIPKNKIKTNQYTRGGEYQTLLNSIPYVGSYYTLYNGRIFSGVDQNDQPQEELLKLSPLAFNPTTDPAIGNKIQSYTFDWQLETIPGQYQNMDLITTYNNINSIDMTKLTLLPPNHSPLPTDENYKVGSFTRYFCIKLNEPIFTELSKNVYTKLKNQDSNYDWKMYRLFVLIWVITGDEEDVLQTNFNQVALVEKRLGKKGLAEYLKGNYIQFYARNSGKILYSNGESGLVLPDGTAYIGYYHTMLDGTIMTGKYHGRGQDIVLTEIYD
jgi:hypothetical protein|tara:strand:+ start:3079 stop:3891 length:813 start_codon:yes stop_codon:yes gene_type:complete